MLKRNKKIVSIIALATFIFCELPINNVTAYAMETNSPQINTKEVNQNNTIAFNYFSNQYKNKNRLNLPKIEDAQKEKTSSLKKLSLEILDTEVKLYNGDSTTANDYITDLIEEIKKNTSVLSNFYITEDILNVSPPNESTDNDDSTILESNNVIPKTTIGRSLYFYFYHNSTLQQQEITNIIKDAHNSLMSKYLTTFDTSQFRVSEANSSDFIENSLKSTVLDIVGKDANNEYFNINSKIPGLESIPYKLNIKPFTCINTSSLSSLEGVQAVLVEINGVKYLLNNVDYAKDYLFNNINLTQNSSINVNIITKDSNNKLHNYSLSKSFETSIKDNDYKFDISNYKTTINTNNKAKHQISVSCPSSYEGYNLYSIANIAGSSPINVESIGNNDVNLQTNLNEYIESLDMYYMDSNGYTYNKTFDNFIDLSNKGINFSESLDFDFVGLNNKSYNLTKINDQTLPNYINILNNKVSIKSLTDEYFIPAGNNTITINDGTTDFILPFKYTINGLQYNILDDSFVDNKITLNNKSKEISFVLAVSEEFSDIELKYSGTGNSSDIVYSKIGTNLINVTLKNIDTLPEIYNDRISVIANNKVCYIPISKDAALPTIRVINTGNIHENNGIYNFNSNTLEFEITDNDNVKNIEIQKNNESPININCTLRNLSDYSFTNNKLTINNIPKDILTTYKIIIEDVNGNITSPQVFEVINDTKTPVINLAQSPSNQYSYNNNYDESNIYILPDKVNQNVFNFYFSISEERNYDLSIIDTTSLSLTYNDKIYSFKENEIQYDSNKKMYFVPLQLPSQNQEMSIAINVNDYANNIAQKYTIGVIYNNDLIIDSNILFGFEGIDSISKDQLTTTSIMNGNNFDLYISKELESNLLKLDANNNVINTFKSLRNISFKLNDLSPVIFSKQNNKFNIPVQSFQLNKGENVLDFQLNCTNGREYTGKISIFYDPTAPSIELIDSDGNNVIDNNYTDTTENTYTGLKKDIKEIRIRDGNKREIDNVSVDFMGENLSITDFRIDSNNSSILIYDVNNFTQDKYSLTYSVSSIFDKDSNPNTTFNSKDRSLKTDTPLKYKYDITKPTIDSNTLTSYYKDTKVFNNTEKITVGNNTNDIIFSDNLSDILDINYRITDKEGNLLLEKTLENVSSYSIPLVDSYGAALLNGQYVLEIKVTDSVGNTSSTQNNEYFRRVFIVDDTKPVIAITHTGLINNDRMNNNFNASIIVSDYDLDYVTLSVEKYTTLNDNNPITVYSKTYDDDITKEGPEFKATIDNSINEILNLSSGIYRIKVVSNDRSSNNNNPIVETSNFIFYDNEKPLVDLGKFTDSYETSKIYNYNNNTITVGGNSNNDIIVTDNMSEKLEIEYFIYDEEGTTQLQYGEYKNGINLSGLSNGRYKIKIKVTDETLNEYFSNLGNFVIDNVTPSYKINGLTYNSEELELLNKPLNLSVEVNDISIAKVSIRVQLPSGEFVNKSCEVTSNKSFMATFDEFTQNGDYTLFIDASDRAGNVLNTVVRRFRIDTTAPIINSIQVNGNRVNPDIMNYTNSHNSPIFVNFIDNLDINADMELTLIASKNNMVKSLKNGDSLQEDGEYTIKAQVKDKAGNMSSTFTFKLTVDTVLPVINVDGVNNGYYYNKDVTPSWSIDDATATLNVTLNGNPFDSTILSNEGNYTLTLKATDLAGNVTTNIVSFVIDKTAPKITIENLENLGYYTNSITPTIKWDDTDAIATILLQNINYYGQEINQDGSYVLYVKVVDKAGNISDLSFKFRLNISRPEITVIGVQDGETVVGGFLPDFKFKDTVEYEILLNGKAYHGEEITADGNYTFVITAKDEDGIETLRTVNFTVQNSTKDAISNNVDSDKKASSNLPIAVGSGIGLLLIAFIGYYLYIRNKNK